MAVRIERGAIALTFLLTRLRAFWRQIEPGLTIDRNNCLERWDGAGEGRATNIAFEGFGLSFSLFIGRTPPFVSGRRDELLSRWYDGEDAAVLTAEREGR